MLYILYKLLKFKITSNLFIYRIEVIVDDVNDSIIVVIFDEDGSKTNEAKSEKK